MVERHLPKVDVASSSLVIRSKQQQKMADAATGRFCHFFAVVLLLHILPLFSGDAPIDFPPPSLYNEGKPLRKAYPGRAMSRTCLSAVNTPMKEKKMEFAKPALYVVGTPIGNLEDFSPRAQETLRGVDFIAAEDTRVTMKLLNRFAIKKPMISCFAHNEADHGQLILERILKGENCALVSDAGMPAISDPGESLVARCAQAGIPVYAVPGPSAFVAALAISGLPTGRFTFEGFLSMNKRHRHSHLLSLRQETRTMIFYEAPHKLRRTLTDMHTAFGERKISLAREITKIHEEVIRTNFTEAIQLFREKEPKGEFVLIIEGARVDTLQSETQPTLEEAADMAKQLVAQGHSASDAAKKAALKSGIKKNDIYRLMMTSD